MAAVAALPTRKLCVRNCSACSTLVDNAGTCSPSLSGTSMPVYAAGELVMTLRITVLAVSGVGVVRALVGLLKYAPGASFGFKTEIVTGVIGAMKRVRGANIVLV